MTKIVHPLFSLGHSEHGGANHEKGTRMRVYDPMIRGLLGLGNVLLLAVCGVLWSDHERIGGNEAAIKSVASDVTHVKDDSDRSIATLDKQRADDLKRIEEIRADVKEVRVLVQRILTERTK